jgi:hypothetical protein
MPKVTKVNVNDTVDEISIPNYKATENTTDRICIFLPNEKLIAHTHYIPGVGSVYCWEGACCKIYGQATIRNIYPIIKYPTNKEGDVVQGEPVIQRLSLPNKKDKSIRTKNKIQLETTQKDISNFDLLVLGGEVQKIESDSGKSNDWVDFTFEGPVSTASWKKVKDWSDTLKDQWNFYKDNILNTIAKSIENDDEYYSIMQGVKVNAKPINNVNQTKQNRTQTALPPPQKKLSVAIEDEDINVDDFLQDDAPVSITSATSFHQQTASQKAPPVQVQKVEDDFDPFS